MSSDPNYFSLVDNDPFYFALTHPELFESHKLKVGTDRCPLVLSARLKRMTKEEKMWFHIETMKEIKDLDFFAFIKRLDERNQ